MTKTRRYNAIHLAYPSTALFVITLLHYSHRIFHQGVFGCGKINTAPIFTSGKSGKRFSVKNAQITFLSDDSSPSVELLEVSPRIAVCAVPYLGDDFRVCTTAGACLVYLCVCVGVWVVVFCRGLKRCREKTVLSRKVARRGLKASARTCQCHGWEKMVFPWWGEFSPIGWSET